MCAAAFTGFLTQAGHSDIDVLPVLGVPLLLESLTRSPVAAPPVREERADRAHSMR